MKLLHYLGALFALAFAVPALAQSTYPTVSGTRVQATVPLQCDATGANCAPVSALAPQIVSSNAYPSGATALAGSQTGAAAAITGTLTGAAAQTTYLAGFSVTGAGATAGSVITVTVTGVVSGPMNFKIAVPTGATVGATPLVVVFDPPLASSAVNTNIVVNVPSFGAGNTDAAVSAWGFRQ